MYIPNRGDVSSAIGAFVIGYVIYWHSMFVSASCDTRNSAMGHLYSRIFQGTAFIAMFNGIGFLVPTTIAATGGLAQNYRGKGGDHYTSSLELALRMIQGKTHVYFKGKNAIIDMLGSRSGNNHRSFQQRPCGVFVRYQEEGCVMGILMHKIPGLSVISKVDGHLINFGE